MEMKKVVGDNATLPCHHQIPTSESLDIEWLLQKPKSDQNMVRQDFFVQPTPHPTPSLDYQSSNPKTIPLKL